MNWKIPLFKTCWGEGDVNAVAEVIRRGTFWACGPEIDEFESRLAEYVGSRFAVTFNSGTSGLHSALLAYDIAEGEVIVPSFTFIATPNAVVLAGGRPVFADIEGETYGLDVEDVVERITPKTKAIIPVHYGGCPCRDIKALKEIAEDHKILLIEDAAESLGARIKDEKVGTFGDSAMFSLCQNKMISTGEGGFVVTESEKTYNRLKVIRSQGRFEDGKDYFSTVGEMEYIQVGYNYRMPTMLAALGLSQLKRIQDNVDKRRKKAEYYTKNLQKIGGIITPKPPNGYHHVYQMYTIQLKNPEMRDRLQKHLTERGIMSRVYFDPIHTKRLYQRYFKVKTGRLPVTEEVSTKVLTLPIYPDLKQANLKYITKAIREFG